MHGKDGTPIGGDAALALGGPVLSLLTDMSIAATRFNPLCFFDANYSLSPGFIRVHS